MAHAQRPATESTPAEKPWPRVGFVEVFNGPKAIPSLGHTNWENGDCLLSMTNAGDGTNRLFFTERLGRVWILQDDKLLPEPFLDISNLTTIDLERGLQALAFPPNYKTSGHFYVFYTDKPKGASPGNLTLARYQVDPKNPNRALPASGEILLTIPHQENNNHNGGQIAFGKDGMLYWLTGDGGSAGDPHNNGQNLASLLGKIIRIDVEGSPDAGKKYRVPPDNPFAQKAGARPEIWALGLRNPWHFAFDPANGDLYIGNVGQENWDEIYYQPGTSKGGENYGWSLYEGTHAFKTQPNGTRGPITFPAVEFSHRTPPVFKSIIGGYVYRGTEFSAWQGVYFFSDWVSSQIWTMRRNADGRWETHQVDDGKSPVQETVSFGTDEKGALYVMGFADAKIYRLIERPGNK
jgi:glucose/arabinose dehydrogenase